MTQALSNERPSSSKCHYFVDEAGDPNLFNHRKKITVGVKGCSTYFMLGLLEVTDPERLGAELGALRQQIVNDPYFKSVPSVQPNRRKTAQAFHAKDDLPEIRRDVYALLLHHDLRFFAVVRDKRRIVQRVREHNLKQPLYRYHPNQLYDRSVSRLFKDRLHKEGAFRIVFARRGTSDRTIAFKQALENARQNFRRTWGIEGNAPIEVVASQPSIEPCLQAADYFLWALQRLFEKNESRYLDFIWPKVSLIHDIDDVANHEYGEYYTQRNPLNRDAISKRSPGI